VGEELKCVLDLTQRRCKPSSRYWKGYKASRVGIGPATRIYLAVGDTDMRKGFNGLHGLVRDRLQLESRSGHLFLFCNQSRNRLKILFWDGTGLWVCAKRLERGRFSWPQEETQGDRVSLTHEEHVAFGRD
jgi:transposase